MPDLKSIIIDIAVKQLQFCPTDVEEITGSGSDRYYIRLKSDNSSIIGVFNDNIKENQSFIYFAKLFKKLNLKVPEILFFSENKQVILQSDIGNQSLLEYIGCRPERTSDIYKTVIDEMFKFQFIPDDEIDYSNCLLKSRFDQDQINWDLNYCKYYFLKVGFKKLDENLLQKDFDNLSSIIKSASCTGFLYRDFQSRNIYISAEKPAFIDFQGGMKGPFYYDLASLIFQARANLSQEIKDELINYYYNRLQEYHKIDYIQYIETFNAFVLLRLLQNLGAYGFRGMIEKKELFLKSIPQALESAYNISETLNRTKPLTYLTSVINTLKNNSQLWNKNH